MPFSIKLSLNQLNNLFLFGFYSSLFFFKPVKFSLAISDLFPLLVGILYSSVWVLVPDIKDGDTNIPA